MGRTYTNPIYQYHPSTDQIATAPVHHPVVIVGAGLAGLSAAIDLALQGIRSVVIDDNNTVSVGSRAICFAKRTLEICDRYGTAEAMMAKGVTWKLGKVHWRDQLLYEFNLLPEEHHKFPAFVNLQQYYFEEYMVDRCQQFDEIEIRWLSKVANVRPNKDSTSLDVTTEDGSYGLTCDFLLVADGAGSSIREALDLAFEKQVFQDRFLIADVRMKTDFPAQRHFWFDPPFHPHQSTLLHKQADDIWRIDFQLGWDANPEEEKKPENIVPRIKAMLGDDVDFELEWASVYTFQCGKMDSFKHRRILFLGDAAHQVSPFGARGGNGAMQGVDNLGWKLARVLKGRAPMALLDTYDDERQQAAKENIRHSSRATDFMTPKNPASKVFQQSVLELACDYPFARALVNSGRLSKPCVYQDSPLNTEDSDDFIETQRPGSACADAPIVYKGENHWLLNLLGNQFVCLVFVDTYDQDLLEKEMATLQQDSCDLGLLLVNTTASMKSLLNSNDKIIADKMGLVSRRYDLRPGSTYLIRPDQHVCARWRHFSAAAIVKAMHKALRFELECVS